MIGPLLSVSMKHLGDQSSKAFNMKGAASTIFTLQNTPKIVVDRKCGQHIKTLLWVTAYLVFGMICFRFTETKDCEYDDEDYPQTCEWTWIDALYFLMVTISTVGYGDFSPSTSFSRWMTGFFVISGVSIIFGALGEVMSDTIAACEHMMFVLARAFAWWVARVSAILHLCDDEDILKALSKEDNTGDDEVCYMSKRTAISLLRGMNSAPWVLFIMAIVVIQLVFDYGGVISTENVKIINMLLDFFFMTEIAVRLFLHKVSHPRRLRVFFVSWYNCLDFAVVLVDVLVLVAWLINPTSEPFSAAPARLARIWKVTMRIAKVCRVRRIFRMFRIVSSCSRQPVGPVSSLRGRTRLLDLFWGSFFHFSIFGHFCMASTWFGI